MNTSSAWPAIMAMFMDKGKGEIYSNTTDRPHTEEFSICHFRPGPSAQKSAYCKATNNHQRFGFDDLLLSGVKKKG
jgi:hypothetical protein